MFRIVRLEEPIKCYEIEVYQYWDYSVASVKRDADNDLIYIPE